MSTTMNDSEAHAALNIFRGDSAKFQLHQLSQQGFSGSSVWKAIAADCEPLCLKRWPVSHPPPTRLPFIHQVLRHAREMNLKFIPEPHRTPQGQTTVELAGSTWELMTWLPGSADYLTNPSPARLCAALRSLALFHRTGALFTTGHLFQARLARTTPALDERISRWRELSGRVPAIIAAVRSRSIPEIDDLAQQWIARHPQLPSEILRQLFLTNQRQPVLQPAIRDLWSDHVLFTGDEVTGFIDFGALRIDTKLVDIARLLGSLAGDDLAQRHAALAAYAEIVPLSADDCGIIDTLDHSGVLIGGWNWLDWLYVQQRQFPSLAAVRGRLLHLLDRQPSTMR
ncbi:phosphotransferase enzyme family protein [Anatilimnocola sp. NA78]|uniref:phosphotransferase enzyme family protein n=1 Tax=Anatilimnocola sp. NA78 TaxID=3415683 RepID=UPI003CE46ECA